MPVDTLTVALQRLVERGVRLDVAEAIAVVQTVADAPGAPAAASVGTLAAMLDALLPQRGVPAALRYTVARGMGAVVAPPFASVEEFLVSLRRFETGDRAAIVRGVVARAAHVPRRIVPTPATRDLAGEAVLRPASAAVLSPAPARRGRWRAAGVAAALVASALAGFGAVALMRPRSAPAAPASPVQGRELAPRATSGRVASPHVPVRALPATETPAFSPAFSANGTALFYQTGSVHDSASAIAMVPAGPVPAAPAPAEPWPAGDLRVMKIVDDGARNYHARPSPDGRFIAFDSDRDGERGVYVADSDGSHVHRVSGPGYAALPTWSPNGTRLAYVRAEADAPAVWNLWLQPLDGRPAHRLTGYHMGQTWSASWFPDGHRIAYSHESTLTVLDLATGGTRRFASPVPGRLVRTPAVSPDGSKIVFQVLRAGVWMLDLADGSMQCVLTDLTAEEFAWAPDGRRFAFHSRRDGDWGVYVLSALSSAG